MVLGSALTLSLTAGINYVSAIGATKQIEANFNNIKVNVEGKKLDLSDAKGNKLEPFIVQGTTYLPVRAIAEGIGKSVEWDMKTNTININHRKQTNDLNYIAAETVKNQGLEQQIIKALKMDDSEAKETRYYYNYIDLNGDGIKEVFVQLVGPYTSGTGGDIGLIFQQKNNGFHLVQQFSLIRNPIIISNEKTNGWNNMILEVSGGGITAQRVELKFNGTKYPNPSDGIELKKNTKVKGTGIIKNDIAADWETGKALYLK